MIAVLFPYVSTDSALVRRQMVWKELRKFGDGGSTPEELAARLLEVNKARGNVQDCAALLRPILDELVDQVGPRRVRREGHRYVAVELR